MDEWKKHNEFWAQAFFPFSRATPKEKRDTEWKLLDRSLPQLSLELTTYRKRRRAPNWIRKGFVLPAKGSLKRGQKLSENSSLFTPGLLC